MLQSKFLKYFYNHTRYIQNGKRKRDRKSAGRSRARPGQFSATNSQSKRVNPNEVQISITPIEDEPKKQTKRSKKSSLTQPNSSKNSLLAAQHAQLGHAHFSGQAPVALQNEEELTPGQNFLAIYAQDQLENGLSVCEQDFIDPNR
jgi:hypothetical protein